MVNLSKELKNIFYKYIKEKNTSPQTLIPRRKRESSYQVNNTDLSIRMSSFNGKIRFYEWSNPNSNPRIYYSITQFIAFLAACHIKLERFELEILLNLKDSYVTCQKGKHDLIIRGTWALMKDSLVCVSPMPFYPSIKIKTPSVPQQLSLPLFTANSNTEEIKNWFG
jgi:hypothetical protein